MLQGELLSECQTETHSSVLSGDGGIRLLKGIKDNRQQIARNTLALILHHDLHGVSAKEMNIDLHYGAFCGELDCVRDQIVKDLDQSRLVPQKYTRVV